MLSLSLMLVVSVLLSGCSAIGGTFGTTVQKVVDDIVGIGKLDFLHVSGETYLTGFMRLAIFFLIFVLLFELASRTAILQRNSAIAVAAILSIISAIFIPGAVLAAIGVAYATLFSFILIGAVIVGGGFLIWMIPSTNLGFRILRLTLILLLIWILSATIEHAKAII